MLPTWTWVPARSWCVAVALCLHLSSTAFAQTVRELTVEGYAHVDPAQIQSKITVQPGMALDRSLLLRIRSDIRSLMKTGKFHDVQVDSQEILEDGRVAAVRLVYQVWEKPVVVQVRIQGNQAYRARRLMTEMGLVEGTFFFYDVATEDRPSVKDRELIGKLESFYRTKSYPHVKVSIGTEPSEIEDELVMVITVEEGEQLPVREVAIEGNTVFSDRQLRKRMQTKRSWWFLVKNEYNEDIFQNDLLTLTYFYRDSGYLDAVAEAGSLEPLDNGFRVNVTITEGEPYTVDEIRIAGNTIFSKQEIERVLTVASGQVYSEGAVQRDRIAVQSLYRNQGYFFTGAVHRLERESETKRVSITYQVTESRRLRFGGVQIEGVVTTEAGEVFKTEDDEFTTKDFVIRRELELEPGDVLDWSQVIEADRRLTNLGYFKSRTFPEPGVLNLEPGFTEPIAQLDDPTVADLLLRLEEIETGFLNFGGGFSTTYGPSVLISLEKKNLFGRGWDTETMLELGKRRSRVQFTLTEPYLLGSEWSFTSRSFWIDREGIGGRTFDEERIGQAFRFGHPFYDDKTRGFVEVKGEETDISEFSAGRTDVADVPKEFQQGTNSTASVRFTAVRDSRNFISNPTRGTLLRGSVELAGVADNEFVKLETSAKWFRRVLDKATVEIGGNLNLAEPFGGSEFLPLQERYFVGGQNSVRGFEFAGIARGSTLSRRIFLGGSGLFEDVNDFNVGGQASIVGTAEIRYPFWQFLHAALFVDTGAAYDEIGDVSPGDLRVSTGAGLRINLPIGAIARFDYGFPIIKESEDEVEHFQFTLTQSLGR